MPSKRRIITHLNERLSAGATLKEYKKNRAKGMTVTPNDTRNETFYHNHVVRRVSYLHTRPCNLNYDVKTVLMTRQSESIHIRLDV